MRPKILGVKTDGYEVYGYVFSEDLTDDELSILGIELDFMDGSEMLEVQGLLVGPDMWVYNGEACVKIDVDELYLEEAVNEYLAFHPSIERDVV